MTMLNNRFVRPVYGVCAGTTQTSEGDNSAKTVSGSLVNVENRPGPPLSYRYTLAGTNTGTNGSWTIALVLNGTTLMTLTAAATTASDWVADFVILFKDSKHQRVLGKISQNAEDCVSDYAAGTVDCSAGAPLIVQIASGHSSDTITCEMIVIEGGK